MPPTPAGHFRIFLMTQPVDFRKGLGALAGAVATVLGRDLFDGSVYVFRSWRTDRLKAIIWDGTGSVLLMKRLHGASFV